MTVSGGTSARGYGTAHQRERARRLARYEPGDLCAIGGEPMYWWPLTVARRMVDLPHDHEHGGYLDGLSCRYHNRAEGAVRGNAMRKPQPIRPMRTSRRW